MCFRLYYDIPSGFIIKYFMYRFNIVDKTIKKCPLIVLNVTMVTLIKITKYMKNVQSENIEKIRK
jgi:hypothetical protein